MLSSSTCGASMMTTTLTLAQVALEAATAVATTAR
jgi:hypothetical protein